LTRRPQANVFIAERIEPKMRAAKYLDGGDCECEIKQVSLADRAQDPLSALRSARRPRLSRRSASRRAQELAHRAQELADRAQNLADWARDLADRA